MSPSDRELVNRMLAHEQRAFDEFFDEYAPRIYRFSLPRVGGDEDLAEDITQATICKAIRKLRGYRGESALFTWLCACCRNEIVDHHRQSRVASRQVEYAEDSPEVRASMENLGRVLEGPIQAADRSDTERLVHAALDHLPEHYGSALEWKYIEGISVTEVAGRLGLSPKATESLLTRARWAFRDAFTALTETPNSRVHVESSS